MTNLAGYTWTWDIASRITGMTIAGYSAEDATFTYDDFGQLTGADRSGSGNDEAYDYDNNGNRETANGDTYTPGTNNQIESDGTFDYLYDDEGNRIRKTEISGGDYVTYEWDYRNRLVAVSFFDDLDALQKRVDYTYDIFNRWIAKQFDSDGDTDFDSSEVLVYDGIQIVLRFTDDSAGPLDETTLANRYVWGPAVDQLMADEQVHWGGSAYVTDETLWPLGDHLNTNRDLVTYNAGTDTSTVANHISLDSFGNVTNETNSAIDEFFLYTGRAFDEDTGLQNNWHRWYDALTGQWTSEDPIGFLAQDPNISRYVGNSVTTSIDPFGLEVTVAPQTQQSDGTYALDFRTIAPGLGISVAIWDSADESGPRWNSTHPKEDHVATSVQFGEFAQTHNAAIPIVDDRPEFPPLSGAIIAMQNIRARDKVRILWIVDHGNPLGQILGSKVISPDDPLWVKLTAYVERDGVIVLGGCNVGMSQETLQDYADAAGRRVIASVSAGYTNLPEQQVNADGRAPWLMATPRKPGEPYKFNQNYPMHARPRPQR